MVFAWARTDSPAAPVRTVLERRELLEAYLHGDTDGVKQHSIKGVKNAKRELAEIEELLAK